MPKPIVVLDETPNPDAIDWEKPGPVIPALNAMPDPKEIAQALSMTLPDLPLPLPPLLPGEEMANPPPETENSVEQFEDVVQPARLWACALLTRTEVMIEIPAAAVQVNRVI